MALRSIVTRNIFGRSMERNFHVQLGTCIRRASGSGRVLDEEGRAKETLYVQKMERERMEKMKLKAEKENADKVDKKVDGDHLPRKGVN